MLIVQKLEALENVAATMREESAADTKENAHGGRHKRKCTLPINPMEEKREGAAEKINDMLMCSSPCHPVVGVDIKG